MEIESVEEGRAVVVGAVHRAANTGELRLVTSVRLGLRLVPVGCAALTNDTPQWLLEGEC